MGDIHKGRCYRMKNGNTALIQHLKSRLFELTCQLVHSSYEKIIQQLTTWLCEALQVDYIAIYVYNNWDIDALISHEPKTPTYIKDVLQQKELFEKTTKNSPLIQGPTIVPSLPKGVYPYVIRIDNDHYLYYCYLFIESKSNERWDEKFLLSIRKEMNHFLKIIHTYYQSELIDKRSNYLFELTSRFHSTIPIATILNDISKEIQTLYPTFSYYILLAQDYEKSDSIPVKTLEYSEESNDSLSTKAFITGELQQRVGKGQDKTYLYVPLNGSQGVYGVIQMMIPGFAVIPKEEVAFITRFANIIGDAIERVTLYQNSTQLVSDLQLINDTSHKLNSNLELEEIIHIIKYQMIESCGASEIGFIFTYNCKKHPFEILSGSTSYFTTTAGHQFATYIFNRINKKPKPMFIGDFSHDNEKTPYRSIMAIPMKVSGTIYGVITIMHEEPYYFSFEKFKLMESLAQHATLALSNTVLKEKLEKAVITDDLTKLYSRNYLDDKLNRHMNVGRQGTLVLFDIDNFKSINDRFGHYIGDRVIIQIATTIKKYIREGDTAARWGGEEFAVYMPSAPLQAGVQLAERIRQKVECSSEPNVTLSCGISSWGKEKKDSVLELFIRADKALYEAKGTGKNRVVSEDGRMQ